MEANIPPASANPTDDGKGATREHLLQEHEELVQLFIHEDSMAWQLTLALLAGNAAVIGGAYGIGLLDPAKCLARELFAMYFVIVLGILLNVVGFCVLQRSKIHRLSRLFRGYAVEAQLRAIGSPVITFYSGEGNIHHKVMLEPNGMATRPLRSYERVEALGFSLVLVVISAVLVFAIVWLWRGRPWL